MTSTPTIAPSANGSIDQRSEVADPLRSVIDQVARNGKADVAFGTPQVIGARTLIPVARVMYGFGGGSGDSTRQQGSGGGGALGVRPFAIIEVTNERVRVVPIVDVQSMMARVFAFATAAMLLAAVLRRARARRAGSHVKIGRIEPHFSVTSIPTIRFRRRIARA